jgi:hypothetical protein
MGNKKRTEYQEKDNYDFMMQENQTQKKKQ